MTWERKKSIFPINPGDNRQNIKTKKMEIQKMKVSEIGQIKHNAKKGKEIENKPTKAERNKLKALRKFKRNNS